MHRWATVLLTAVLAGCASRIALPIPSHDAGPRELDRPHGSAKAALAFHIPSSDNTSGFVPAATSYVIVTIHGVPAYRSGPILGAKKFSATFSVPSGTDDFDVTLLDQYGKAVAHTAAVRKMEPGRTTVLRAIFHGVVARIQTPLEKNPPVGKAVRLPFTVEAFDNDGDLISGSTPFDKPVLVRQKNSSQHVSLKGHVFVRPTDKLYVAYDGRLMTGPVAFAFSAPLVGTSSSSADLSFMANAYATYPTTLNINDFTIARDHSVWFTACSGNQGPCEIDRVGLDGKVARIVRVVWAQDIASGPDGNVWFTEGENVRGQKGPAVGKLTPAGQLTQYLIRPEGAHVGFATYGITAGSDGAMWFTELEGYDRITTDGVVTAYPVTKYGPIRPKYMLQGTDGKFYFDGVAYGIFAADNAGNATEYGSYYEQMAAPLVWHDGRLILLNIGFGGAYLNGDGSLTDLTKYVIPLANGPQNTLLAAGPPKLTSSLYGIQVLSLNGYALLGPTYPEVESIAGHAFFITKIVADDNGYFWAMNASEILRFRYKP